ncbi:uncharacterized protein LOC100181774 [Ciona intestinalis]
MSPNKEAGDTIQNGGNEQNIITTEIDKECHGKKLVGYRGNWYDVTNFAAVHPGGDVINMYVGKDATFVMDGMHRFDVLKGRRPVGKYNITRDAFGEEMNKLEKKLRQEGYYDESLAFSLGKCGFTVSVLALIFTLVNAGFSDYNWATRFITGFLLALFWQQSGILMHDFMHSQGFRRRKWDEKIGVFFGTFCFGISARWWKDEHIIHHSFTNTVCYETGFVDPQAHEDVWAQNEKLFPWHKDRFSAYLVKIQHFLFFPLAVCAGRIGITVDSLLKENRRDVWVAWFGHVCWVAILLSQFSTIGGAASVYITAALIQGVLHIQLILNHYCKRFYTKEEHHSMDYYRAMIEANLNITCPVWMDWFHGGLNFHHEHHCFPRLPRNRMREVSAMIKKICKKHAVFYDECTFSTAVRRTLSNMFHKSILFQQKYPNL